MFNNSKKLYSKSTDTANCCVMPMLASSSIDDTLSCCAPSAPYTSSVSTTLKKASKKLSFFYKLIVLMAFAMASAPLMAETRVGNIYWMPKNATLNGIETDGILSFIFWLTTFVFFAVQITYIIYLIKYRRRPGVKAHYSHGNNTLEIIWTTLPTVIFLGLAIYGNRVWYNIHRPAPADAINIEVTGYQFAWDMRYPGASGVLARSDVQKITSQNKFGLDLTDPHVKEDFTTTELVIPVGKPVHLFIRSRDVIHSVYIPEFRLYQDAVPGRTIAWVWFKTFRTGHFQLACSQLCGKGHYNMKAPIRVVSQEEYNAWYTEKIKKPNIVVEASPAPSLPAAPVLASKSH